MWRERSNWLSCVARAPEKAPSFACPFLFVQSATPPSVFPERRALMLEAGRRNSSSLHSRVNLAKPACLFFTKLAAMHRFAHYLVNEIFFAFAIKPVWAFCAFRGDVMPARLVMQLDAVKAHISARVVGRLNAGGVPGIIDGLHFLL